MLNNPKKTVSKATPANSDVPANIANLINMDQGASYTGSGDPNVDAAVSSLPGGPPAPSATNSNTINDTKPVDDGTPQIDLTTTPTDNVAGNGGTTDTSAPQKPTSKLRKGMDIISGIAAGLGVMGRNRTGLEAVQNSQQFGQEVQANRAKIAQEQAGTAEQQQETARKASIYGKQPAQTYEEQIALSHKAAPVTEESDITGKRLKVVPQSDGSAKAIPIEVQGAIGSDGKPATLQGDPSKIDPFTSAVNAFVAQNKRMPVGDEMSQIVKDTSPRYITGVDQNASRERIAAGNNIMKLQVAKEATNRALGAAQIHWNAAQQMYNAGQFTKYDLENSRGDITMEKQILANIGKDYAQNPRMRALGITNDDDALAAVGQLQQRMDTRLQLGQARINNGGQKYKFTATDPKTGQKAGSNDGKTWVKIKQQ